LSTRQKATTGHPHWAGVVGLNLVQISRSILFTGRSAMRVRTSPQAGCGIGLVALLRAGAARATPIDKFVGADTKPRHYRGGFCKTFAKPSVQPR